MGTPLNFLLNAAQFFAVDPATGKLKGPAERLRDAAINSGVAAKVPTPLLAPLEAVAGAEQLVTRGVPKLAAGAPAAIDPLLAAYGTAEQAASAEQRMQDRTTREGLTKEIPTPKIPPELLKHLTERAAESAGVPTTTPATSETPASNPIRAVRMPNGKIVYTNRPTPAEGTDVPLEQATAQTRREIAAGPEMRVPSEFAPNAQIRQNAALVNAARDAAATGKPGGFVQAAALPGTPAGEEALLQELGVRAKAAQLQATGAEAGERARTAALPPTERAREKGQQEIAPAVTLGLTDMLTKARQAARAQAEAYLRSTRAKEYAANPAQFEAQIQAQEQKAAQEIIQQIIALGPGNGRAPQTLQF